MRASVAFLWLPAASACLAGSSGCFLRAPSASASATTYTSTPSWSRRVNGIFRFSLLPMESTAISFASNGRCAQTLGESLDDDAVRVSLGEEYRVREEPL